MANHHPAPELLTAFSAGSLQLSHALCVSTHLERCDECRANLMRLNSMGAKMMEDLKPARASEDLKSSVLAMLDDAPKEEPAVINRDSRIPRALQQFIPDDYDSLQWHHVSPSIQAAKLVTDSNGSKVEMLRIKPGGQVPSHTHTGDEYTLLLEGSFSDESGIYKEGDFVVRDGRHKHKPMVTEDKECICLTVTDAPIEFTGFFTRWLNPILRRDHFAH
ncbi:ChrR family anti-sigma-E factor [Oceanicoccus sagamiensis]|uniref:Anti-sigma factor n=1 Tax=Oceanicoccus sagamiensis TaxID=716816 RepID=A0A1X9N5Q0_9GAMM|nr:ChrR family anti-sigma-E factor [Oceanicoccus sagamiensis]ARN73430.1 anti-sigma factor [Oceanicoccus sagamiensis]